MTIPRGTPDSGPTGVATSDWLTKAEAAAICGCDERTIERAARAGRLGTQARPGFPTLYNPADVELEAKARRIGVRPVILAADPTPNPNGHGALEHQRHEASPIEALLVQVLQALREALAQGPTVTTGPTLFLTVSEAAARSGLSAAWIRQLIDEEKLPAMRRGRFVRIRVRDLEAL